MTGDLTIEVDERLSALPSCAEVKEMRHAAVGQLVHIQQVSFQNSTPKKWGLRGPWWNRVRQTTLGVIFDEVTLQTVVVQTANAAVGQFGPVQGEMKKRETVYDAFSRECFIETGLHLSHDNIHYLGSALCPVSEYSLKAADFDHQLFHCVVAKTSLLGTSDLRCCDKTNEFATVLHGSDLYKQVVETASETKCSLLKQILQEAITQGIIPESVPVR